MPLLRFRTALALLTGVLFASTVKGAIRVELRPEDATPLLGRSVRIDMYAFSDDPMTQSIGAINVGLQWDPSILRGIRIDSDGPYPYAWLLTGFSQTFDPKGYNRNFRDGDALYVGLRQLNPLPPAFVPSGGLLITTLEFTPLRESGPTAIEIFGGQVFDGLTPNLDVTGTMTSTSVRVVPEPTSFLLMAGAAGAVAFRKRNRMRIRNIKR